MNMLPSHINASAARLPLTYEAATKALAQCASLDECQDWADKAAALASYAKQADDDQLEKMAVRIRARAIRRCGELLKQFDAQGKRTDREELSVGSHDRLTQRAVAERAGMSPHQELQAVRVANVPEAVFTQQVESPKPPTISQLAKQGIKPPAPKGPIIDLKGRDPHHFNRAMHSIGPVREYAKELAEIHWDGVLPILIEKERDELRSLIAKIDRIHDMIATRI